jgi:hypothetical protein
MPPLNVESLIKAAFNKYYKLHQTRFFQKTLSYQPAKDDIAKNPQDALHF